MSLSALNHLKSELQRKKEDAEKKKRSIEAHQPTPLPKTEKEGESSDSNRKKLPELTSEEQEKAKKARDILEAKAKLYDSLSEGVHLTKNSNLYLVNFEQKAVEDFRAPASDIAVIPDQVIDLAKNIKDDSEVDKRPKRAILNKNSNEDQELRKCSDKELLSKARNFTNSALPEENESKSEGTDEPTLISADMQRERKRQKWEEDERMARSKDEIHYQDILFDEVRSHGTGYFAFSKDEEERRRQLAELEEMRKETLRKQEEFRKQKVSGDVNDESDSNKPSDESEEKEEVVKELTEEEKLKNIEEALKLIRREVHVREWDKGKEIPVMTQEEWIEKKRNERDDDFAPPELYFETRDEGPKRKRAIQFPQRKALFQKKPSLKNEKDSEIKDIAEHQASGPDSSLVTNSSEMVPGSGSSDSNQNVRNDTLSSSQDICKETKSHPVKNPKKSAMAFLEQLQDSPEQDTNDNHNESVTSIPLPQDNRIASGSSQNNLPNTTVDSIPLPPEKPNILPNSNTKTPLFVPFNLIPRRFTANVKPKSDKIATVTSSNLSTASVPLPPIGDRSSNGELANPFTDPKLSKFLKEPENSGTKVATVISSDLSTHLNILPSATESSSNKKLSSPCTEPKLSKFLKESEILEIVSNSNKVVTAAFSDLSTTSVTFPSAVESSSSKRLSNLYTDPKLSKYLKEPENLETVSCESNEPKNVAKLSSDVISNILAEADGSSSNNEGSRIKLGNLIRNRPAPKSGKALLEEIKNATRDFGPEDTSKDVPRASRKRGAEIAPPDCLLQATPQLPVRKKGLFSKKEEISDSISAGLQTLKTVTDKKKKKTREKGLLDIL